MGLLVVVTGCRQIPSSPTGQGAFDFVVPEAAPSGEAKGEATAPNDAVMPAEPILPLAVPVYPKAALLKKPGLVIIGARITIDPTGMVSDVASSPVVFSSPNSYGGGFREAVDAAVAQWRFVPAVLQHVETGPGVGGGQVIVIKGTEKTTWAFDVAFRFTADGEVLGGVPGVKDDGRATASRGLRGFFVRLFRRRMLEGEAP